MRRRAHWLFALALGSAPAFAAGVAPVDEQFQVNSYTFGLQTSPDAAAAPSGDVLVVWQSGKSPASDASGSSIQGRLVGAGGVPLGADLQINTYTTDFQEEPRVAADAGGFLVLWNGEAGPGDDRNAVVGRRVGLDGVPLAADFLVNDATTGTQVDPAVDGRPGGGFVVSWTDAPDFRGDAYSRIRARRLDGAGDPVGAVLTVDAGDALIAGEPAVASASDGSFVVSWSSTGECYFYVCNFDVRAMRYASDGTPTGAELTLLDPVLFDSSRPPQSEAAALPTGDFVVAWAGPYDYVRGSSTVLLEARRVPATSGAADPVIEIGDGVPFRVDPISLATAPDGSAAVSFTGIPDGGDDLGSIYVNAFDPVLGADGSPERVNTYTANRQRLSAITSTGEGSFLVVWESRGSVGDDDVGDSIQARRLIPSLFRDGFESGDTIAWSEVVGEAPR